MSDVFLFFWNNEIGSQDAVSALKIDGLDAILLCWCTMMTLMTRRASSVWTWTRRVIPVKEHRPWRRRRTNPLPGDLWSWLSQYSSIGLSWRALSMEIHVWAFIFCTWHVCNFTLGRAMLAPKFVIWVICSWFLEIMKYGLEKQSLHSESKVLMQFCCAGAQCWH